MRISEKAVGCLFHRNGWAEKGQGLVEYALLLAFVVIVAAAVIHSEALQQEIAVVFASVEGLFGE